MVLSLLNEIYNEYKTTGTVSKLYTLYKQKPDLAASFLNNIGLSNTEMLDIVGKLADLEVEKRGISSLDDMLEFSKKLKDAQLVRVIIEKYRPVLTQLNYIHVAHLLDNEVFADVVRKDDVLYDHVISQLENYLRMLQKSENPYIKEEKARILRFLDKVNKPVSHELATLLGTRSIDIAPPDFETVLYTIKEVTTSFANKISKDRELAQFVAREFSEMQTSIGEAFSAFHQYARKKEAPESVFEAISKLVSNLAKVIEKVVAYFVFDKVVQAFLEKVKFHNPVLSQHVPSPSDYPIVFSELLNDAPVTVDIQISGVYRTVAPTIIIVVNIKGVLITVTSKEKDVASSILDSIDTLSYEIHKAFLDDLDFVDVYLATPFIEWLKMDGIYVTVSLSDLSIVEVPKTYTPAELRQIEEQVTTDIVEGVLPDIDKVSILDRWGEKGEFVYDVISRHPNFSKLRKYLPAYYRFLREQKDYALLEDRILQAFEKRLKESPDLNTLLQYLEYIGEVYGGQTN